MRQLIVILALTLAGCGNWLPVGPKGDQGGQGIQGDKGDTGLQGQNGHDGQTCSVVAQAGGALVTCGLSSVFISDGTNGTNGNDGAPAASIAPVPFCPGLGGGIGYNELGLRIGNDLYAVYYDGSHTFLTKLTPGNYSTTDGRGCSFSVDLDGNVH